VANTEPVTVLPMRRVLPPLVIVALPLGAGPALGADPAPSDPAVEIVASFDPEPQFHLGRVTLEGDLPPGMRDRLGLTYQVEH
jgi:hypothetical protein